MAKKLNILFLISEADPLIKVGGLGDVGGTLPIALKKLPKEKIDRTEIDIRVVIPYHDQIKQKNWPTEWLLNYKIQSRRGFKDVYLSKALNTEVPIYLIDGMPIRNTGVYSSNTHRDLEKYAFFSVVAFEFCRKINWKPDIIHAHDWHTALTVKLLAQNRSFDPFFSRTKSLYTIHNLPYSGGDHSDILDLYDIRPAFDLDFPDYLRNLPMAIGLDSADHISTVSKTYAEEITTEAFGCGYQTFLRNHKYKLSGILNGIMMDQWNPATDHSVYMNFDINHFENRFANKQHLQADFNLKQDQNIPLFVMVGRMTFQKGIDLAIQALNQMNDLNWQAIFLGTGEEAVQRACIDLENQFPDRVRAIIRFDEKLSRKMYAGGDMLLMPSRYEPCGITQMISMLYGCIPIACATGGLKDTIKDPFDFPNDYTGFLFENADIGGTEWAMRRAIEYFYDRGNWKQIQIRAMNQDFSWDKQALEYFSLYNSLLSIDTKS